MAKLLITQDGVEVREVLLEKKEFTIGRDLDSDIPLDDLAVSRQHARIIRIHTDLYIEDLNSTNGTKLNNRPVTKHLLKGGDCLSVGGFTLRLIGDDSAEQGDTEEAVVIQPQMKKAATSGRSTQWKLSPKVATLRFFRGPFKGSSDRIERSLYTFGRPGEDVAVIARRSKGFYLLHIGGVRYPKINDQEIDSSGGVQLQEGDVLEVGENLAEISFG